MRGTTRSPARRSVRTGLLAGILGLLLTAPVEAQQFDGTIFAGGALMTQDLTDEFTINVDGQVRTGVQSHDNALALGTHLGVRWDRLAVEGTLAWIPTKLTTKIEGLEDITEDQTILILGGSVLYDILPGRFFDVFVAGGAGVKRYSADDPGGGFEAGSDFMFNAGLGARLALSETLSIRMDARDYISTFDAFEEISGSDQDAKTQHDILLTIGLRYLAGR